jgi:hypothetical protein
MQVFSRGRNPAPSVGHSVQELLQEYPGPGGNFTGFLDNGGVFPLRRTAGTPMPSEISKGGCRGSSFASQFRLQTGGGPDGFLSDSTQEGWSCLVIAAVAGLRSARDPWAGHNSERVICARVDGVFLANEIYSLVLSRFEGNRLILRALRTGALHSMLELPQILGHRRSASWAILAICLLRQRRPSSTVSSQDL